MLIYLKKHLRNIVNINTIKLSSISIDAFLQAMSKIKRDSFDFLMDSCLQFFKSTRPFLENFAL